jgi:hypothetical protein
VPIVHRGLRERGVETKKKAAQIVGNMSSLVTEPKDMIPYIGLLLPEVKKVCYLPMLIASHLRSQKQATANSSSFVASINVVYLLIILFLTISCRF